MSTPVQKEEFEQKLQERFTQLPKVVQDAITSAGVEGHLRELADVHKLHLDQWESLENEVMLALFGFQPIENLQANIKKEVGVADETAAALATDISRIVFEPIRAELERELEHPEAKVREESGVEAARTQVLSENANPLPEVPIAPGQPEIVPPPVAPPVVPAVPLPPPVLPATPPPAPPTAKAVRMPASGAYKPGEASHMRKDISDDPYREPPA